ncbi:hypothetical protein [Streptomyces sp. TLI_185]|uniref:hypothetical protein n=1 Tax=Streptomyces sp. TLI_185 TaxID=2485151 RepID=UPI000F51050C|nr:hypothetical protein [Streptomyces sp. TLI_185]RPF36205.1 hypothetical protein EDD92_6238 [Streptomyces sp. TLI_185]
MSSSEMLETPPGKRRGLAGRRARMVAVPAMLLSLTVGGLGLTATAHAADSPQCPPGSSSNCGQPDKGKAPITGDAQNPGKLTPGKVQDKTLKLWRGLDWLREFMNEGGAGQSSRNHQGSFRGYIAHTFDHDPSGEGERTGTDRFVRAISTGDVRFTRNHHKAFIYVGKF